MSLVNPNTGAAANTDDSQKEKHVLGGTTVLDNMENVVETSFSVSKAIDDLVIRDQSISDFLAKPYLLSSFTSAGSPNDLLYSSTIFSAISSNTYWTNKFQGYRLFRGTAVFTLTCNAMPFQQGKLLMHFLPSTYLIETAMLDSSYVAMHNAGLATKTQQPNVECDLRDTVAVLKIPYVTPYYFAELADLKTDWGSIYVSVLAQTKTGAGQTYAYADLSLYLHFEDWEMAAPMVPQGPASKKFSASRVSKSATVAKESEAVSKPSDFLNLGSSIAGALSSVPILSGICQPAGWVLRGMAGLASHFGYSKPNQNPQLVIGNTNSGNNYYSAVSNGLTAAPPLSLDCENQVTLSDQISITKEDEMSMAFLKKVKMMYTTINWAASATTGTTLSAIGLRPDVFTSSGIRTNGGKTVTYYMTHPVAYVGKSFQYYRGSIQIHLKMVGTQFHTGRLQITYTPKPYYSGGSITAPTLSTSNLSLRQIVDIRDDQEVLLNIPYINNSDWLQRDYNMGQLSIIVLNPLVAPTTCADNIDILFYCTFGEDFELSCPIQYDNLVPFSPQIGEDRVITNSGIGSSDIQPFDLKHDELCVGEAFTSIRQLLLRVGYVRSIAQYANTCQYMMFWPWQTTVPSLNSSGTLTVNDYGGDSYNTLSQMYAFYRGGMRVAQLASTTGRPNLVPFTGYLYDRTSSFSNVHVQQGVTAWATLTSIYKTGAIPAVMVDANGNMSNVTVPYYNMNRMSARVNFNTVNTGATQLNFYTQPLSTPVWCSGSAIAANSWAIARGVKDDFQLSYFVGCPPYMVTDPV